MSRYSRDQALQQRISRTVLTDPDAAKRYHTDAATHLQIEVLRNVLLLADKAMEAEGVGREVRDRVVHWILVGEPPPSWEDDPDARLDRAVTEKMAEWKAWIRYLEGPPSAAEPVVVDYATDRPAQPFAPDAPELTEEQKQAAAEAASAQIEELKQRGVSTYDLPPCPASDAPLWQPFRGKPRTIDYPFGG